MSGLSDAGLCGGSSKQWVHQKLPPCLWHFYAWNVLVAFFGKPPADGLTGLPRAMLGGFLRRWLVVAGCVARPDEGYLFVTNRGDEAVFAAERLRSVSPSANVTFVSDRATLRDVGAGLGVFDVVVSAEAAMPDLDVHDSMGFRLQKLRGMLLSPYDRTVYMDSDTFSCKSPDALFRVLEREGADVACVMGGRGNHSGASAGVLAYARGPASAALWRNWERVYRGVMRRTRREQPSFQKALALAQRDAGLVAHRIPMAYNCRNVRHCRATALKDGTRADDGCVVIHAHDFEANVSGWKRAGAGAAPTPAIVEAREPCPTLSGAHRVVFYLSPPGADPATRRVADAMARLKVDNDFSICGTLDARDPAQADDCVRKSNKYAVVILGAHPPPPPPERDAPRDGDRGAAANLGDRPPVLVAVARHPRARLAHDVLRRAAPEAVAALDACLAGGEHEDGDCFADVLGAPRDADVEWFCGGSCAAVAEPGEAPLATALRVARDHFLLVGAADRPDATVAELERALPSHFLRLASHGRRLADAHGLLDQMRHAGGVTMVRKGPRSTAAQRDADDDKAARREAAFLRANPLDVAFYDQAVAAMDARARDCAAPS